VNHRVEFSPEALADLLDLYDYIAMRDGVDRAMGYIDRIEKCCRSLTSFPERGVSRADLRPGLRVLGFERRGDCLPDHDKSRNHPSHSLRRTRP
jgi:toxin ParE1/3/4